MPNKQVDRTQANYDSDLCVNQKNMPINKEIKNSALLIAIITAVLYLHGLAFHQGFLRYWGIEETIFPVSFERTLVAGYIAYMNMGSKALVPLCLAFIAVFSFTLIFNYLLKTSERKQFPKFLYRHKKKIKKNEEEKNSFSDSIYGLILFSGWGVIASYVGLVSLLVLIILGKYSDKQGYEIAASLHSRFDNGTTLGKFSNEAEITYSNMNENSDKGKMIIWGNNHCAIYIKKEVVIINTKDIKKITSKKHIKSTTSQ